MALGQRLKEARRLVGLSQEQLGELVGMTQAAIGALEKRDSQHSKKAYQLAEALEVSAKWLMTGDGPMRPDLIAQDSKGNTHIFEVKQSQPEKIKNSVTKTLRPDPELERLIQDELQFVGRMDAWDSSTPLDEDEVELPLFREVELAAGVGQTQVVENHGAKLRFAKSTLSRAKVLPENAACAFVRGNSMEPVMPDGTCVGVNTADTAIRDGEIYAIDHDGMLRVKYLHRRPGGGLKIVSQNSIEHPTEEYTAEDVIDSEIRIIGRVFWWSVLR